MRLAVGGRVIRLGDIARVYRGQVDPPVYTMRFGGKQAIGIAVAMTATGDVLRLGENLAATMARIKADLPIGIEFAKVSDQPRIVRGAVGVFVRALFEAVAIVLVVSFISLGMRAGAVVALVIPLVLAATFLGMAIFGIDLHRVSTGALVIALGLLVDDAMIAVEMMTRKIEEGFDKFRAATFAYTSTAFPMLTGTLITAAGFLPIATAKSTTGEYTFAIFAVVTMALLISWVMAVTAAPFIGSYLLKEKLAAWPRSLRYALLPRAAGADRALHAPSLAHAAGNRAADGAGRARHAGDREAVLSQLGPRRGAGGDVAARRRQPCGHAGAGAGARAPPGGACGRGHLRELRGQRLAALFPVARPAAVPAELRPVRHPYAGRGRP